MLVNTFDLDVTVVTISFAIIKHTVANKKVDMAILK